METVAGLLYEEWRSAQGFERDGKPLATWDELKRSLRDRDVLDVAVWEAVGERAKKVFNYVPSPDADATESRPWVNPSAPELDRP